MHSYKILRSLGEPRKFLCRPLTNVFQYYVIRKSSSNRVVGNTKNWSLMMEKVLLQLKFKSDKLLSKIANKLRRRPSVTVGRTKIFEKLQNYDDVSQQTQTHQFSQKTRAQSCKGKSSPSTGQQIKYTETEEALVLLNLFPNHQNSWKKYGLVDLSFTSD